MNCAIYARKSTEQNGVVDESKSVARQVEHARAYAERKGWTVAEEHAYVDDGVSGALSSATSAQDWRGCSMPSRRGRRSRCS